MNAVGWQVFRDYWGGGPEGLYWALLAGLASVLGIALLIIFIRVWTERNSEKKETDDTDVVTVVVRALFLLFVIVAVFNLN